MNALQALRHFLREASIGLVRSWRVSLLAVLTIGVSIFLAGAFLLVSRNLAQSIAGWREEARFVVYLHESATPADRERIDAELKSAPWVLAVDFLTPAENAERFEHAFPSLAELVADARYGSLPASFEAHTRPPSETELAEFHDWSTRVASMSGVEMVDDDRDWIEGVRAVLAVVRAVGSLLTGILLGAAIFTVAAVVRLTSFLYRDEIAIMRLVGATEFFIRGPFYVEGVLQGLLGAALAAAALVASHALLAPRLAGSVVFATAARLGPSAAELGSLLAFGAAAGLAGALVSLGRERPRSESS
jgi:cell division transport system permease protein